METYKEIDKLYHDYAKANGLSDMAFWILFSLWEDAEPYTQREFCNNWYYSPQTVNSALKGLEKQGVLELAFASENRKNK